MLRCLHLMNFFDCWNYEKASQTEVKHTSTHGWTVSCVYVHTSISDTISELWKLVSKPLLWKKSENKWDSLRVMGTCSSLGERGRQIVFLYFRSALFSKILLPCFWLLALWDGTNLAVYSCTTAINVVFLSLKCEVISFHILIFLTELSFVVEQIRHTCCWIFHANGLSACLENGTVSEYPVTQNLRNLDMCLSSVEMK